MLTEANCETGAFMRECTARPDPTNPEHYQGGVEVIDYLRVKLTPDEFRGYLRGNVIKYLSRAGRKGPAHEDYAKAAWYSRMLAGDDPRK